MFISLRIKDNEPCPCGSGSKYRDCCKGKRSVEHTTSRKPIDVQAMESMRAAMKKCCLHPDKDRCKGKIKAAHALQNNKIISMIAGKERHVYMLDPKRKPVLVRRPDGKIDSMVRIARVSANAATTETCFCDYHDNVVFAAIEKGAPDFDESNEEMKFVYAYKAFIFEYYKQWINTIVLRECFIKKPEIARSIAFILQYRMSQLNMREYDKVKEYFDSHILTNTYDGISTCVVRLSEQIHFAAYAYIGLDVDMNGKRIKNTVHGVMHRLAVTVFPEKKCSWLIMSCLENERYIYDNLFSQFREASEHKIKFYLSYMLPLYSENLVLSPVLWGAWSPEVQGLYEVYANLHDKKAHAIKYGVKCCLRNAYKMNDQRVYKKRTKFDLFPVEE